MASDSSTTPSPPPANTGRVWAIPCAAMLYILAIAAVVLPHMYCAGTCSSSPCSCPGGTPLKGDDCLRAQADTGYVAACAACPAGYSMNAAGTACTEIASEIALLEGSNVYGDQDAEEEAYAMSGETQPTVQDPCRQYSTAHTCVLPNMRSDSPYACQPACRWAYAGHCKRNWMWAALGVAILATILCVAGYA